MILVDADVLIDLWRRFPAALNWFGNHPDEEFLVPGFAAMELIYGCRNGEDQRKVELLLRSFRPVWLSVQGMQLAYELLRGLHLSNSLGVVDALIARTSLELELPLHTFNVKHYAAVSGLITVQPYPR